VTLTPEIADLLRLAATSTITAQLQRRGIRNTFLGGLRPLQAGASFVGTARTLRFGPMRDDLVPALQAGVNAQRRAVESLQPGDVLVIDARNEPGAGTIGDVLAMRALRRGAVGVVTDGGVRDADAVAALDIAVYARSVHGATFSREHLPLDVDVPVACAGVLVMPGDVMVGDADGVVVVPAALAGEVAMDAAEQELRDAWAFERVSAGDEILGVFPVSDARLAEYEAWRAARRTK
jgi:5-oxopent-3-ene-1,2,5-tricarboxylate decarboxylase / 2-hydroxyhepta-2,4-diene-1,7-dioate isomerase